MNNSIWLDLLDCKVRYVGKKFTTRIIEKGEGDALILLHGGGGHAEAFSRNISRLGNHFHTIAMDFIWHGLSSKPVYEEKWLQQFAEQILDVMDALGIEKAALEGESLGGWPAMWLALHYPERLSKIILNTAWGMKFDRGSAEEKKDDLTDLRDRSIKALSNPSRETSRARLEWLMADPAMVTDELVEVRYQLYSRPDTQQALIEYYNRLFSPEVDRELITEDMMEKIKVPTLVFWTDHNPIHGTDAAKRMAELMDAEYYCMENAGHWPQWEKPEEHDKVITDFLLK